MKSKVIFIYILFVVSLIAQNDIENVLTQIKAKLDKVNDYSAQINIAVNMDFLKMPKSKAQIFFKKPNKFRMKSSSFAILPKAGIDFNPQKILDYNFNEEFIGDTLIDDKKVSLYKIIPNSDTLKFDSAILAIDLQEVLIKQITLLSNKNASIVTKFKYDKYKEFAMPSELKVLFDFSDVEPDNKKKRRSRIPKEFKGEITITYSKYEINKGINDSIFIEEDVKNNEKK